MVGVFFLLNQKGPRSFLVQGSCRNWPSRCFRFIWCGWFIRWLWSALFFCSIRRGTGRAGVFGLSGVDGLLGGFHT